MQKWCWALWCTVGRINFEDKKFWGFRGYLLNLEIKYPCNFLYTRSRFFVQHVHMVGKWLALWKYFKRATEVKTSLPSPTGSLYQATFSCRAATIRRFSAATKEIKRVIDTIIMMGHYTYEGLYVSVYIYCVTEKRALACKLVDCTLLITE